MSKKLLQILISTHFLVSKSLSLTYLIASLQASDADNKRKLSNFKAFLLSLFLSFPLIPPPHLIPLPLNLEQTQPSTLPLLSIPSPLFFFCGQPQSFPLHPSIRHGSLNSQRQGLQTRIRYRSFREQQWNVHSSQRQRWLLCASVVVFEFQFHSVFFFFFKLVCAICFSSTRCGTSCKDFRVDPGVEDPGADRAVHIEEG